MYMEIKSATTDKAMNGRNVLFAVQGWRKRN